MPAIYNILGEMMADMLYLFYNYNSMKMKSKELEVNLYMSDSLSKLYCDGSCLFHSLFLAIFDFKSPN